MNDGRNSLEQIVRLPDEIATEALSKNQLRARSIARDLTRLRSTRAKGGQTLINSSTIREKLQETYSKSHHQTVNQVIDFIAELGGEHVHTKKHRTKGHRQLVIDLLDLLDTAEQLDAAEIDDVTTNGVMATVSKG